MQKQWLCKVKVGNVRDRISHHVNNFVKYAEFLDSKWSDWKYIRVIDKNGNDVYSFTKNDRPTKSKLTQSDLDSFALRLKK
jgi:hypothetical protein